MKRWLGVLIGVWALMASAQTPVSPDSIPMAEDFSYVTAEDCMLKLSDMPKDRLTLMVLYDPDCKDCRQMLFSLRHSSVISQRVGEELLQVLAVDVDANEALWKESRGELPDAWTKGLLKSDLSQSRMYDTSAVPMLYLLDADQRIIMADNDVQTLISILISLW